MGTEGMDRNSESTWWTRTRELRVHHGNGPFSWSWEIYTRDDPPKHLIGGGSGSLDAVFHSAQEYGGFNPNESLEEAEAAEEAEKSKSAVGRFLCRVGLHRIRVRRGSAWDSAWCTRCPWRTDSWVFRIVD